jgi:hypothetical protein
MVAVVFPARFHDTIPVEMDREVTVPRGFSVASAGCCFV